MVSFQAEIGWKRLKKRKIIIVVSFVPTQREIQNSKKIAKKLKKLKNTIVASFHAKIGWKRLRKIENKKLSFRSVLTRCVIENYKKKKQKNSKIPLWFHSKPK